MGDFRPATAPNRFAEGSAIGAATDTGAPRYNQRLTDKILAAFNHAYSIGEAELSSDLWETLVAAEKIAAREVCDRKPNQALELATLWMAFVDARNTYYAQSEASNADPDRTAAAFEDMKTAYLRWVSHVRQG